MWGEFGIYLILGGIAIAIYIFRPPLTIQRVATRIGKEAFRVEESQREEFLKSYILHGQRFYCEYAARREYFCGESVLVEEIAIIDQFRWYRGKLIIKSKGGIFLFRTEPPEADSQSPIQQLWHLKRIFGQIENAIMTASNTTPQAA